MHLHVPQPVRKQKPQIQTLIWLSKSRLVRRGCTGCTCTPWKNVPLRNVHKRRESSAQICRQKRMCMHVPHRYDKIKTKKAGKKEGTSKKKIYTCFYRLSYCILRFWTTIQAQQNRSEHFKIIGVYVSIKAISSDRRYLRQIATTAFNLGTWDNDTWIGVY